MGLLELSRPVQFEPVGQVTTVFFDDKNQQVFSVLCLVDEKWGCFSWLAIFTSRGFYLEYSSGIIFQTFRAGLCRNHSDSARRESGEAGCGPGKGLARD